MKKSFIALGLTAAALLASCGTNNDKNANGNLLVSSVSLDETIKELELNDAFQLTPQVTLKEGSEGVTYDVELTASDLKELAEQFKDEYDVISDRDWSEYIYNAKDFILQEGKKYSAKRNHVKKFKSLYNYTLEPFKDEDRDEIEEELAAEEEFDDEDSEDGFDEEVEDSEILATLK